MRALRAIACAAAVAGFAGITGAAAAAPRLPLRHAGRWITDAGGRVVIVHGINMVYKLPPYYPSAARFGADDAVFLNRIGFNVVRVGVIWKALEPQPGMFDDTYLANIAATVSTLARHGIVSLLDFHQDMLNERFQGEGFPDWAIEDGGLTNPKLGFPGNYLGNLALEHALDQFWANAKGPGGVGLQDRFAAAWAHVAGYFKDDPAVLGYELFNEPFPGTLWEPCLVPTGCPGFDAKLTSFYARVAHAIRAVDPAAPIWYEPNVLFNNGVASAVKALSDPDAGFAFHDYCLTEPQTGTPAGCDPSDDLVFKNAVNRVATTHEALIETEFGATNDTAYLDDMVARADRFMVPWIEWAYCGCEDPTTSGPGAKQAIVIDPRKPPTGSNLVLGTLSSLVEPYPQVIAGTPQSWSYDRATRTFSLTYTTARAGGGRAFGSRSQTEIAAPPLVYRSGYAAAVVGGAIDSKREAGTLTVSPCKGATAVKVTVRPTGSSHGSCPPPRMKRKPKPHRHRSRGRTRR